MEEKKAEIEIINQPYDTDLPVLENMDAYIDYLIPEIKGWSEDLYETEHYEGGAPWLEFRDDENFNWVVLHFFNPDNEYLISIDGNVYTGTWRLLESNKLILDYPKAGTEVKELYDLTFLNSEFFILKKNGNQEGKKKYFVMAREPFAKKMDWRELMEQLHYKNRFTIVYIIGIILVVLVIVVAIIFSSK